jgi:hypothetical protein
MVLFEVNDLALKILVMNMNLPFITLIYKIYKNSYRWLTNAQNIILSMLANLGILCYQKFEAMLFVF